MGKSPPTTPGGNGSRDLAEKLKPLGLCIPLSLCPDWRTEYSVYVQEPCPDCRQPMWVGQRLRALRNSGSCRLSCMVCAIQIHRIRPQDALLSLAP
jgi:hypothetical protein